MIALIIRAAGMHPSFLVGSELNEVGTNAGLDSGEWLIVEADESDGTFLRLSLDAAIVTNVDHDHLWYWRDMDRLEDAFGRFVDAVDGPVVLCADDDGTRALAARTARRDHLRVGRGRAVRGIGLPRRARRLVVRARRAGASCSGASGCRWSGATTRRTRRARPR